MFWIADVFVGTQSPEAMRRYYERAHAARAEAFASAFSALGRGIRNVIRFGLVRYRDWAKRRATIGKLSLLNDHYLADIGFTRADVEAMKVGRWPVRTPEDMTATGLRLQRRTQETTTHESDERTAQSDWKRAA